jgi:hypothetical protein
MNNIMQSKSDILLESLTFYFSNNNKINQMLPIINGQSHISLRILDWFITNYCKKNKTNYKIIDENNVEVKFIVYIDYKAQLKAYNKRLFDPFCRRNRISFKYNNNNLIITTIGQLNFFKWAIKNNIINYVEQYIADIEKDMITTKKDKIILDKTNLLIDSSSDKSSDYNISSSDKNSDENKIPKSNNILTFE